MHEYEGLKYMIEDQLNEYAKRGKLSGGDLAAVHMLTDTFKNLCKIKMLQEQEGGESHRSMRYDGGMSGRHYVRGHYSRDGGSYDGSYDGGSYDGGSYDSSYDRSHRGYSRDEAKDYIVQQVEEMMGRVHDQRDRETLKRIMQQMQNG